MVEISHTSIAVLFSPPPNPVDLDRELIRSWMTPPIRAVQAVDGSLTFDSVKDQIDVSIGGATRLLIRDLSGQEPRLQVPTLVYQFLARLNVTETAYGLNYELLIPWQGSKRASAALASLIKPEIGEATSLGIPMEAQLVLAFDRPPKRWNLTLREGERGRHVYLYYDFNLHQDLPPGSKLPDRERLLEEFARGFREAKDAAEGIAHKLGVKS